MAAPSRLPLGARLRAAPRADLAAAAVLAATAAVVLADATGYPPSVVPGVPGPAAFPRLIALAMLVLAATMLLQALRAPAGSGAKATGAHGTPSAAVSGEAHAHGAPSAPAPKRSGLRRNLSALALLIGFLLIAERTDFFVAMALMVGGLMALLGERAPRAAALSLLFVLFLYLVFYRLFGVQFPTRF